MPEMDGITFVKCARHLLPDTAFIMLSQVSSKEMIASAYAAGIEFYIQKPINSIEVISVIEKVAASLTAQRTLKQVQNIFSVQSMAASNTPVTLERPEIAKLRSILQKIGISGEKGSQDIISLIEILVEEGKDLRDITLNELCSMLHENPKSVEQRIRRAALAGMVNLAHLGLEDYSNDTFVTYSSSLYNFEQVRKEMDYIRGKSNHHGNVKIKGFLNALLNSCYEN